MGQGDCGAELCNSTQGSCSAIRVPCSWLLRVQILTSSGDNATSSKEVNPSSLPLFSSRPWISAPWAANSSGGNSISVEQSLARTLVSCPQRGHSCARVAPAVVLAQLGCAPWAHQTLTSSLFAGGWSKQHRGAKGTFGSWALLAARTKRFQYWVVLEEQGALGSMWSDAAGFAKQAPKVQQLGYRRESWSWDPLGLPSRLAGRHALLPTASYRIPAPPRNHYPSHHNYHGCVQGGWWLFGGDMSWPSNLSSHPLELQPHPPPQPADVCITVSAQLKQCSNV